MNKNVKRYVLLAMIVSLIIGSMDFSGFVSAAKKVSLTKSAKVTVGKSSVITLKNNQKKVTWKVVKGKNIVKITKKSKTGCTVKGLKKGTAIVQADVAKKSYKGTVTVIAKKARATANPDETVQPDDTPVSKVIEYDGTNKNEVAECKEKFRLVIKDGVDKIPDTEFRLCTNLAEVIIPASVTYIGSDAFGDCYYLKEVTIPESVKEISCKAFNGCSSLESINVDRQNKVYDSRENCNAVIKSADNELIIGCKNTIIPVDISKIGNAAFYRSVDLKHIDIPQNIKEIGDEAFGGCKELKSITIASGVTKIGKRAFSSCSNLTNIKIPSSVIDIGIYAFEFSGLESIPIASNITEIKEGTFLGCDGLKDVSIPSNIIDIRYKAFSECFNLVKIKIPSSVKNIDEQAFMIGNNLTNITWNGNTYNSFEEFYTEFSSQTTS